jgi:hypothetical protein
MPNETMLLTRGTARATSLARIAIFQEPKNNDQGPIYYRLMVKQFKITDTIQIIYNIESKEELED